MPTYDYKCNECDREFSRLESMERHEKGRVRCPKCKSDQVSRLLRSFYAKTVRKS